MSYAYHRLIRKVVIAFGNIFNNISLARYDANGVEQEHFLVPIVYAPKEKMVTRIETDPDLQKQLQVILPRMSFEITGISYDPQRKQNSLLKTAKVNTGSSAT